MVIRKWTRAPWEAEYNYFLLSCICGRWQGIDIARHGELRTKFVWDDVVWKQVVAPARTLGHEEAINRGLLLPPCATR